MSRTCAAALVGSLLTAVGGTGEAQGLTPYTNTAVDTAHGDREFHLLWPDGAPGAVGREPVDRPKITVYRAPADKATGAAVVVCPGGGYQIVAANHEGKQIGEWLNSLGVSAFVLQYRLGPRYRHPAPLQDAQRAVRMVRSRAKEWDVDPKRIGILASPRAGTWPRPRPRTSMTGDPTPPTRSIARARGRTSPCSVTPSSPSWTRRPTRARGGISWATPRTRRSWSCSATRGRSRRARRPPSSGTLPTTPRCPSRTRCSSSRPCARRGWPASSTSFRTAATVSASPRATPRSPSGHGSAVSGWRASAF